MPSSVSESASWWRASTRSSASTWPFMVSRNDALFLHLNQQCPRVFHFLLAMVTLLNFQLPLVWFA